MADASETSAPSPGDGGLLQGSEAWNKAQEIQAKLRNHGAAASNPSDQSIRCFVLSMDIHDANITEHTPLINLYNAHKGFIAKLYEVTSSDTHILPTATNNSDDEDNVFNKPDVDYDESQKEVEEIGINKDLKNQKPEYKIKYSDDIQLHKYFYNPSNIGEDHYSKLIIEISVPLLENLANIKLNCLSKPTLSFSPCISGI